MVEETVFKSEENVKREEAADRMEKIAEKIRGGSLEISSGGENVSLEVPESVELELKVEEEGSETSLEVELEWEEGSGGSGFSITD